MTDEQKIALEKIIKQLKDISQRISDLNSELAIEDFSYQLSHILSYAEDDVDSAIGRLQEVNMPGIFD